MTSGNSIYTSIVSSVLFPLHERIKGHDTVRVKRQLEHSQWWSPDRIADLQAGKLRRLIHHAYRHVPYYRHLLDESGIRPNEIQVPGDLEALPFLTKSLVRAHMEELKSRTARKLTKFNTGGSTGEPLIFFIGKERVAHDVAAKWRATRWWGVDIGDPEIVIWGSPIELGAQDRLRGFRDRLLRTRLLPAFEMSEANLNRFVEEITRIRPRMLFGYPTALALIARHAEKSAIRMDDLGIRVAFVTAEHLYDDQRETISQLFGCKVANGYGGRDAGFIAHQCPEDAMHITAEDMVLEIVDRDGNVLQAGSQGEVVVTHLATGDFPFIRYRTGDIGVLSDRACPCGRGLPILKDIAGRTTDFIVAPDGTIMHGLALIYVVRDITGISEFKIIQKDLTDIRIQLVPAPSFDKTKENAIRSGFIERLGQRVQVTIEQVRNIPKERSGKFRHVVSNVNMDNLTTTAF